MNRAERIPQESDKVDVSKRRLLINTVGTIVAGTGLLSIVEAFIGGGISRGIYDKRPGETVYIRTKTDTLVNIGVNHEKEYLPKQLKVMQDLITASDVVLLEWPLFDGYFAQLKKLSTKLGKEVYDFDSGGATNALTSILLLFVNLGMSIFLSGRIAAYLALHNNLSEREKDIEVEKIKKLAIKSFLLSQLGAFPTQLVLADLINFNPDNPITHDYSFTLDGRTVIMAWIIKKLQEKDPTKKIVAITGDEHAKLIDYYLKNENELELKKKVYSIAFFIYMKNLKIPLE